MIYQGDCLQVLTCLENNSVDSLVTDPPAGISFMGKGWDSDKGGRDQWIAWMAEVMAECHRVLKPGAHGLVWALPRTSHWTATACENAGFEIRDIVHHLFGSGFPKSMDISKAIDKAAGADREVIGAKVFADGSKARTTQKLGGNSFQDPTSRESNLTITSPSTDSAKQWQGWGTALKPAAENWILIRKPCSEKTVAANVLKHGTGGINIDAGRIGNETIRSSGAAGGVDERRFAQGTRPKDYSAEKAPIPSFHTGRFPANLVFSHSPYCTDLICDLECAIRELDAQSGPKCGAAAPVKKKQTPQTTNLGNYKPHTSVGDDGASFRGDTGGASRFFYCAKISSSERNAGLEEFPDHVGPLHLDGGEWAENKTAKSGEQKRLPKKNHHPTVKPKKLMTYLIKLITPPGGTVLDPFMGSGSTGLAAKEAKFGFIGIEREPEYYEIAKARINGTFSKEAKHG